MLRPLIIIPMKNNIILENKGFAYFPITFFEEVKYICKKMVIGNCILNNICEKMSALKVLLTKKILINANSSVRATPVLVVLSFMLYDFLKIPEKILPPDIPAVRVEATPENKSASAKIVAAALPNSGLSKDSACDKSVTDREFL